MTYDESVQQFMNYHSNHSTDHMHIDCLHKNKTHCILPSQCSPPPHLILTRNSDFCPTQHFVVGLCNGK